MKKKLMIIMVAILLFAVAGAMVACAPDKPTVTWMRGEYQSPYYSLFYDGQNNALPYSSDAEWDCSTVQGMMSLRSVDDVFNVNEVKVEIAIATENGYGSVFDPAEDEPLLFAFNKSETNASNRKKHYKNYTPIKTYPDYEGPEYQYIKNTGDEADLFEYKYQDDKWDYLHIPSNLFAEQKGDLWIMFGIRNVITDDHNDIGTRGGCGMTYVRTGDRVKLIMQYPTYIRVKV